MDRHQLIENITAVTNLLKEYQVSIILLTVNVATGRNQEMILKLKSMLADLPSYDRTSINAWEDAEF